MKIALLLVLLLSATVLFNRVRSDIVVTTYDGTEITMQATELLFKDSTVVNIIEPLTSNVTNEVNDSENKFWIVFADKPVESAIIEAQEQGCIAVIIASPDIVGGRMIYRVNDHLVAASINITVIEVGSGGRGASGSELLRSMSEKNQISSITILPLEENPWTVVYKSGWVMFWTGNSSITLPININESCLVFFMAFSATNITLAIVQLVKFHRYYGGCMQSMALYVLLLEIGSNAIRIVAAIDYFGNRFIYSSNVQNALGQAWIPLAISSLLLFILYWHELMTNASIIVHPFIVRMRVPFFIISAVLVVLAVIAITLRAVYDSPAASIVANGIFALGYLFIIIFYAITAIKLLKRLSGGQTQKKNERLKKTTIKVLLTGGFLLIDVAFSILFVLGTPYFPKGYISLMFVVYFTINGASMTLILSFEVASKKSVRTSVGQKTASVRTDSAMTVDSHTPTQN